MSILYSISVILLFITMILVKKSEKKLDIVVTLVLGIALLLCYNTFVCYIFTMCHIPIHLGSLSIINSIIIIGFVRKNAT